MKISRLFWLSVFSLVTLPALAAPACYSSQQMQAEQLLRLHSELMVLTVTCRQASDGQPLTPLYTSFTRKNLPALHNAEETMKKYYTKTAKGDPIQRLDRLRTLLGNEYGQKSANMTAPGFCASFRDKVSFFERASPTEINNYVQRMTVSEKAYAPMCARAAARKAR